MIGLLRDGVEQIRYCDTRPYSKTKKRHWTIAAMCICESKKCGCYKREPHYETFAKEVTYAEAEKIVKRGRLCLECGG
jgi:hypothetical protein